MGSRRPMVSTLRSAKRSVASASPDRRDVRAAVGKASRNVPRVGARARPAPGSIGPVQVLKEDALSGQRFARPSQYDVCGQGKRE